MKMRIVPCGYLKVRASEMVKPLTVKEISNRYDVDEEGYMKLAMNALLVEKGGVRVLIDPGTADFLPAHLREEYGFEQAHTLEGVLLDMDVDPETITDVLFTHLHFDHGSGAFKRVPGNIVKRFSKARYHVLKEHYQYALRPEHVEASSFSTFFLKRLEKIHWLEDWDKDWLSFKVFHGHTRGMVVPVFHTGEEKTYFMSDLLPLEIFMEPGTWCGYDLEPELLISEKQVFLKKLNPGSRLIFYHDALKESIIYS
jgi:glyoxylase-like metal-dependent hydrolase (beta-lactamase superfamily II)